MWSCKYKRLVFHMVQRKAAAFVITQRSTMLSSVRQQHVEPSVFSKQVTLAEDASRGWNAEILSSKMLWALSLCYLASDGWGRTESAGTHPTTAIWREQGLGMLPRSDYFNKVKT